MMKTLLQINSVVNYGSTGRIVEELGQLAINNGWRSYVAYGRNSNKSKSKLIKIGTACDVKTHGLQTRLFDRHGLGSCNATKKLIEQIKEIKPDIIHLHNLHGYYLNINVLFKYLNVSNIPIVWTFHDCWAMTGHCSYFDFAGCDKWKTECYNCPQKKEYPSSFGLDQSKRNYNLKRELFTSVNNLTIVPVSKWLEGIVRQSFLAKFPIQVINNGINIDIFHALQDFSIRDKYKLKDKFIILGVANVWEHRKGLKDFIELSINLDLNYQIILVGLTESQKKKLPSNIICISKTQNTQELQSLYSTADVFVNPSEEETFGLTTVEAFACGTPAIVYNATGSPELITSETGIIVEKGDITGLINAINIIKEKGKSSFSIACREHAKKFYNKNDRYLDYINLYESMLKQKTDII